jgi:5-formyltetrahydrofolate cyclo-ligase
MQDKSPSDKIQLRKALRAQRRGLSPQVQHETARTVAEIALDEAHFPLGQHIALFMSADGEVDTGPLLDGLMARGKACYLPVLVEDTTSLLFRQLVPGRPLVTNVYGLKEPDAEVPVITPEQLDTVFMPLVGFDGSGNRLGMGKGYYDRTFAFLTENATAGPVLIGLAHECQRVGKLEAAAWDVPLWGILTGLGFTRFR